MADTGYAKDLIDRYRLNNLPQNEIVETLTDYGRRCALDKVWNDMYKGYRKVCGHFLKP